MDVYGGAAICNYTASLLCTRVLGTVGVSGSEKALCGANQTCFVNLSCSSLAMRGRRRAKPDDSGNSILLAVQRVTGEGTWHTTVGGSEPHGVTG
jgi:hypothetical protein